MIRRETRIINRLGLHARAAAKLVRLANEFHSDIRVLRAGQSANAKTIIEVLMLGAALNDDLVVETEGDDEEGAAESLIRLIESRFEELE